MGQDGDLLQFL